MRCFNCLERLIMYENFFPYLFLFPNKITRIYGFKIKSTVPELNHMAKRMDNNTPNTHIPVTVNFSPFDFLPDSLKHLTPEMKN